VLAFSHFAKQGVDTQNNKINAKTNFFILTLSLILVQLMQNNKLLVQLIISITYAKLEIISRANSKSTDFKAYGAFYFT
jgi:hypothetical protein